LSEKEALAEKRLGNTGVESCNVHPVLKYQVWSQW